MWPTRDVAGGGGEKGVKEASLASCNFYIPCTQGENYEQQEGVTSCRHGGERETKREKERGRQRGRE